MNPLIDAIDFNERPSIAIWEVTQACDLACVHCRASAQPHRGYIQPPLRIRTTSTLHVLQGGHDGGD
jgi:MoaA/NifB/PqqE/SkfB family radical SAM enzyme